MWHRLLVLTLMLHHASSQAETALQDPQFFEIAPCPCDLTPSVCDIGCCCDADCSDADKQLFTCIAGKFGGDSAVDNHRSCSSSYWQNPDYHQLTCVLIEDYNAYLGRYYPVAAKLSSVAGSSAVNDGFRGASDAALSETTTTQTQGALVLARRGQLLLSAGAQLLANSRLSLPRRSLAGACDIDAGVSFIAGAQEVATCDVPVTAAACQAGVQSQLDYQSYLTSCTSGASCVQVFNRDASQPVPATVSYQMLSSNAGFQKGAAATAAATASALPGPLSPAVAGAECTFAVVKVSYTLQWRGTNISSVSALVQVANLSIDATVTQQFDSQFVHADAASSSVTRSGVFGYRTGSSVLFGQISGNSVNTSSLSQLQTLQALSGTGQCSSTAANVIFPFSSATYCTRSISAAEFANCSALRISTSSQLQQLVPASAAVGIFGAANASVLQDWVQIVDADIVPRINLTAAAWENNACLQVPTELQLTLLFAEQGKANDQSILQIVAASTNMSRATLRPGCRLGDCNAATDVTLGLRIQFIQVPPDWATNPSAAFGPYRAICWWDICWQDMIYPLTDQFVGDSRQRSLALTLILMAVILYAFCVSRPWW